MHLLHTFAPLLGFAPFIITAASGRSFDSPFDPEFNATLLHGDSLLPQNDTLDLDSVSLFGKRQTKGELRILPLGASTVFGTASNDMNGCVK